MKLKCPGLGDATSIYLLIYSNHQENLSIQRPGVKDERLHTASWNVLSSAALRTTGDFPRGGGWGGTSVGSKLKTKAENMFLGFVLVCVLFCFDFQNLTGCIFTTISVQSGIRTVVLFIPLSPWPTLLCPRFESFSIPLLLSNLMLPFQINVLPLWHPRTLKLMAWHITMLQ